MQTTDLSRGKVCWKELGVILFVPVLCALCPLVLAIVRGESRAGIGLAAVCVVCTALALVVRIAAQDSERSHGAVLATMALAWLVIPALGSLPFIAYWWSDPADWPRVVVDGLFESFSGFTSCGLTVSSDPSELPASLQLWRSISQWVGGVGIAVLMLTVANPASDAEAMIRSEVGTNFGEDPTAAAKWIWAAYGAFTVVTCGAFLVLGMPWWEALNHSMSAVSTGGFTVTSDSLSSYSEALKLAVLLVMVLSAISFAFYFKLCQARWSDARRHGSVIALLVGILAAALFLMGLLGVAPDSEADFMTALFQAGSAFATGGFATTDLSEWGPGMLAVMGICMFIGGASGSTAGGVKLERIGLIARAVWWRVERELTQDDVNRERYVSGETRSADQARLQVETAATLVAIWVGTIAIGTVALSFFVADDITFDQVSFEVISALSSVGLSAGVTSPELSHGGKLILSALMWIGRLEIFASFYLIVLVVGTPKRRLLNR